jgi:hypothetical protein
MKKTSEKQHDELREEYDFSGGRRGVHAARYAITSKVIPMKPESSPKTEPKTKESRRNRPA